MAKATWIALTVVLTAAACGGGADVGNLNGRGNANGGGDSGEGTSDPTQDDAGHAPTTDGGDGIGDGGGGGGDAGSDAGGATNAFTGAPAFVAQNGGSTIRSQGDHPFAGGNPAKQDCLTSNCHGAGGDGPRFFAGGTVYKDAAGTMPAAQVEVRIRDAAGDAVLTHTDANGNFFVRANQAANVGFPAQVGARDGTTTKPMVATIANGACNSTACHGGPTGVVHVP